MTSLYDVQRQGWRLECNDKCVLKHAGKTTECVLIEISISGVLLSCDDYFAENMSPGDVCGIHLCGDTQACPSEIVCRVVRRDSGRIALKFRSTDVHTRGD